MADEGILLQLDPILAAADLSSSPWDANGRYRPDYHLARNLLAVPISRGAAAQQQSGRVAKALDAWIAHELRRAGFPRDAVWPRVKEPRVLPPDVAPIEDAVAAALARIDEFEKRLWRYSDAAAHSGYPPHRRR